MDYILLKDIKIYARHGCLPEESILGTWFTVNIKMGLDLSVAGRSGKIEDTVNYALIYKLVKTEIQKPEKLLESVAYRIARKIMNDFPLIETLEFRLAKQNPPLGGEVGQSEIVLNLKRE